jgi:hypothetical protein
MVHMYPRFKHSRALQIDHTAYYVFRPIFTISSDYIRISINQLILVMETQCVFFDVKEKANPVTDLHPIDLWDVEAPTFSRKSAHRWRWGCQPYAQTGRPLLPGRCLALISVRRWVDPRDIVRLEGLRRLKNPMTLSGIEPVTLRLVA